MPCFVSSGEEGTPNKPLKLLFMQVNPHCKHSCQKNHDYLESLLFGSISGPPKGMIPITTWYVAKQYHRERGGK